MGLWLFIGLLIGSVVVFMLMQQRVSQQAKTLKHNRMRLEQIERDHQHRIRSATLQLKEDYGRQLAEQKGNYERQLAEQKALAQAEVSQQAAVLEQAYVARIQFLEQAVESSQGASRVVEAAPSNVSALPGTPDYSAAAAPAASQSSTAPESAPHAPPIAIAPDRVKQSLSGFVATSYSLTQRIPFPTQAEPPLAALTADSQQVDPSDRKQVATALGQFVTGNKRATAQRSIPILGKLIQDPDPSVRQAAVKALGRMRSVKVIPLLKRALRDTDSDVVQTASSALSHFKGAPCQKSQPKTRKKLPRNR